ncbi:DUF4293 domain-containing protein [Aquimarina algicola]|uniref:DUF4293 family protein n=1 Tax=Aquimarina algicola TaxID=2589995 RepID=A0A504ISE9_9FLAO|nr:DUF4293 domain-containing protein [Aquimarina algicola]TPN81266.1 DUF4293 family protein [Aquimarina algicola]
MLQRIQTIYLLIAGLISGLVHLYLPYATDQNGVALFAKDNMFLLSMFSASAALSLLAIFMFKNRKLQFVLGRLNILLNFILLGVFVYWSLMISGETNISEKGIGMMIPIISIVLLVVANKAIKKDENLVKSVDRLR